ncbi:MAG: NYN domain-containing protein [Rhodospirillaceae bacterium]|nr:NYN domain-containing protein [Rhodospirillaceae bacterium]
MKRLAVYIDGFNLYHAIDDLRQPHLKWLDLWALAETLAHPRETVAAVHYFSAFPTWRKKTFARHREYVKALESRGVTVHLASFKKKPRQCFACGATWTDHEEKETDVHVAVQLVADALTNAFDRAILISADSDLAPAIRKVREVAPRKAILVAAPPGRFTHARDLEPKLEITRGRVVKCLLPERIEADGKTVATRPANYTPPKD